MTFEQVEQQLRAEGWRIWSAMQTDRRGWRCRIINEDLEARTSGQRGAVGFDRECWIEGSGPTLAMAGFAALCKARPSEQDVDLDDLLG